MPSGSSDDRLGLSAEHRVAVGGRYGGPGFAGAVVTILVLEFLTAVCMLAWYLLPVTVLPAVVLIALIAWGLRRGRGAVAQIGRGMLIGCLSVPLTLAILIPAYLAARAMGLV